MGNVMGWVIGIIVWLFIIGLITSCANNYIKEPILEEAEDRSASLCYEIVKEELKEVEKRLESLESKI